MSREMEGQLPEGGDALLAAEYVLGVQTAAERAELTERVLKDSEFARLVLEWEERLSPLNEYYAAKNPPVRVKTSLDRVLFSDPQKSRLGLWNNLILWRGLAVGALALSAMLIGPMLFKEQTSPLSRPIVSAMQSESGEIRFIAFYEPGSDEIRLSKINSQKADDQDYELWLIEADGTPQSIGVIADSDSQTVLISPAFREKIDADDVFAVSIEPLGGSPTGDVTGPVIAVGQSRSI